MSSNVTPSTVLRTPRAPSVVAILSWEISELRARWITPLRADRMESFLLFLFDSLFDSKWGPAV
jgi:hypothetical protein